MRTTFQATVTRVVDGDTIEVEHAAIQGTEPLRILALDTEESTAGSAKPVTRWGHQAKAAAEQFFLPGDAVQLEFPGDEPLAECLAKYRGNYDRLLVYVTKNGVDFQERMIRAGFSPYFTKYGYAPPDLHALYDSAERDAQSQHIGLWNHIAVNGSEIRNYAVLGTWWRLRAEIIDRYRAIAGAPGLFNSRLDYATLQEKAPDQEVVTVFTDLHRLDRVRKVSALIRIGSLAQPFSLFLPDIDSASGQRLAHLLKSRYISVGDDHPRRGYAYVTGKLGQYRGAPQIIVDDPGQIQDGPPPHAETPNVP